MNKDAEICQVFYIKSEKEIHALLSPNKNNSRVNGRSIVEIKCT